MSVTAVFSPANIAPMCLWPCRIPGPRHGPLTNRDGGLHLIDGLLSLDDADLMQFHPRGGVDAQGIGD
jgi:hypothetical protein